MSEPPRDLRTALEDARTEGLKRIADAADLAALEVAQIRTLGRKADLARARAGLRAVPLAERRDLGKLANDVQHALEDAIAAKRAAFEELATKARWDTERIDVTLPGELPAVGGLHPLTRTTWEIVDIFIGLGWKLVEGPEVEYSRYNFDAINTPPEHPARSEQDTYYVAGSREAVCLRTQTSPVQIRTMEKTSPPVYAIVPGRVYRRDELDATHLNQFAQIEGLAVDEGISMADLKGSLLEFARALFGRGLDVRFRPHYFPFTEPSAEMDVECFVCRGRKRDCRMCKGEGWIELLGCGMVHPFLLEWVGYDTEKYTGFAFGIGVERAAALAHGVPDIRYLYDNDLRFLTQFKGVL